MFEIDNDVDIPGLREDAYGSYPFGKLQVGQSFFVPTPTVSIVNKIRSAASKYSKRHAGLKFITRSRLENDVDGLRIWRAE